MDHRLNSKNKPWRTDDGSSESKLNRYIEWLLLGTLFILPVLFTIFTFEIFETPKTILLLLVDAIVLGLTLYRSLKTKVYSFKKCIFYIIPVTFALIAILSSIFSSGFSYSIYGINFSIGNGLINLLSIAVFAILFFNNVTNKEKIFKTIAFSGSLVAFFLLVKRPLPWSGDWAVVGSNGFVTLGMNIVEFFAITALATTDIYTKTKKPIYLGLIVLQVAVAITFTTSVIDWILLFFGIIIYVAVKNYRTTLKQTIAVSVGVVLGLILITFFPLKLGSPVVPIVEESWRMTFSAFGSSFKNGLVGQGLNNFVTSYNLYKNPQISQSDYWDTQFPNSYNSVLDWINNTGLIGLLFFLMTIVLVAIKLRLNRTEDIMTLVIFLSFFFYQWNTTMLVLFFILIGMIFSNYVDESENSNKFSLFYTPFSVPGAMLRVISAFVGIGFLLAAFYLLVGSTSLTDTKTKTIDANNVDRLINQVEKAKTFAPSSDTPTRILSNLYNQKAFSDQNNAKKYYDMALDNAAKAIDSNKSNYSVFIETTRLYAQGLGLYGNDIKKKGLDTATKAIQLNPFNPSPYFLRGYFQDDIKQAIADTQTAINIRSDFINPYLQLCDLFIKDKQYDSAQNVIDYLKKQFASSTSFQGSDVEKAINDLQDNLNKAKVVK